MTNLEKITQIDTISELLYNTNKYDSEYCQDCQCEEDMIKKKDCLECIKKWLNKEETE